MVKSTTTKSLKKNSRYDDNHIQLIRKGKHEFKTESDCEVIVPLFEEYGDDFVNLLDGKFSFVLSQVSGYLHSLFTLLIQPAKLAASLLLAILSVLLLSTQAGLATVLFGSLLK